MTICQELSGVCHTKAQHMISLITRPLAWRGRVGAQLHSSCTKVGMLTWPMTVIDGQWCHGNGFIQTFTCSLSLTARYSESLCYALFLVTVWQKLRGAMSRTVAMVSMVSVNDPRIIAVCGDNLNVGTYVTFKKHFGRWSYALIGIH